MDFFRAVNDLFNTIGNWFYNLLTVTLALDVSIADPIFRLVQAIVICTFAALTFLVLTYTERKVIARVQDRIGPNRVGPFGLLQPFADAIKMFTKEQTMPSAADAFTFQLAPSIAAIPVLMLFAVIPFNENVVASDMDAGLIYIIAFGSLAEIAILMGGWGSRNKYSLLGAMRAVAQMISYEIPLVLALMSIAMLAGTLNLNDIVRAQAVFPFVLLMPVAFIIFLISAAAETGRSPFDIIEAESEIVAGYHTEYAGMQFGLFQMAEFLGFYAQSCIMATIFFGGWQGPAFFPGWLWFWLKSWVGVFIYQWAFRSVFPRLRIDQLQAFCWKFLVPAALVNVGITSVLGKLHEFGVPGVRPLVERIDITEAGRRVVVFGPQDPFQWGTLLVIFLLANLLTIVILALAYRGVVRRTEAQLDSKVPGGVASNAPVEREVAAV